MTKLNLFLGAAITSIALIGCNSGSSNTPSSGNTPYNLQNYLLTVGAQTNNCTLEGDSLLNCDSNGTFGGTYTITFNTPNGSPGAYVVMPPTGDTYGLNIAPTGNGCTQTASSNGETYTCNFTIGTNGTAQAGNTVYLNVDGSLGTAKIVTINLE